MTKEIPIRTPCAMIIYISVSTFSHNREVEVKGRVVPYHAESSQYPKRVQLLQ